MKRGLIGVTLVAVASIGSGFLAVLNPPTTETVAGDALMVHAGGRGERLEAGLTLVRNGAASTLVIMHGTDTDLAESNTSCGQSEPFVVLCPAPTTGNTVGEARELGELAEKMAWRTVVVVTSDYHLRRSSILDRKCAPAVNIQPVAAPTEASIFRRTLLTIREVIALPQAFLTGC